MSPLVRGSVALALSWVFTATTVWSAVPLSAAARPARADVPLPAPFGSRGVASTLDLDEARSPSSTAPSWTDRGRDAFGEALAALLPSAAVETSSMRAAAGGAGSGSTVGIFGPRKFERTTGPKNEYTETVTVPAWVTSPFTLQVQNGNPDGSNRVSSAWIYVNGTQVAGPSDFNQNVPGFTRSVTLTPSTVLKVVLASQPRSFLILNLGGERGDHTAPRVTWANPAPQAILPTATPALLVRYADLVGSGETAASGVDTSTLRVTLDGADRTSLFTRGSAEASAQVPATAPLLEGPHTVVAAVSDRAGNEGQGSAAFQVDLTPPQIAIVAPPPGVYLRTVTPEIRVQYSDAVGLDLPSLRIFINGSDRTSAFQIGPTGAASAFGPGNGIAPGPVNVVATIADLAGHPGQATLGFNVDTLPPVITIGQPIDGSRHGSSSVEAIVQYHDDQRLDTATFEARVDGTVVALGVGTEGARGVVSVPGEGSHRLDVKIRDQAGNESSATAGFSVDTGPPTIRVVQPPPGFTLNTATPPVVIAYSDTQGIDTESLRVTIDGADRTSWCVAAAESATCTILERLPEGAHTVAALIKDQTGNPATASSDFTVDTKAPTAALADPAPQSTIRSARPAIRLTYADGGSGVDVTSVHVFVDQQDRTAAFSLDAGEAVGTLPEALADGGHEARVTVADRAGNVGEGGGSFTVDTTPPSLAIVAPANAGFISQARPVQLTYGDPGGSGIDPASLQVALAPVGGAPVDITASLAVTATGATGALAPALADGGYRLSVSIRDRAGNTTTMESGFEIDTVPPQVSVVEPAAGGFVSTARPTLTLAYSDGASGVAVDSLVVTVDETDVAGALTKTATTATGLVPSALGNGPHLLAATVRDRAGNSRSVPAQAFTVDTTPPTIAIETPPDGAYLGVRSVAVRVSFGDADVGGPSAIATFTLDVDGTRTALSSVGSAIAEGTLDLADGPHVIRAEVADWADNRASASSHVTVDTLPPVVAVQSPAEGSYHRASPVEVSGSVVDADPEVAVECRRGDQVVPATVSQASFTCPVPLLEGANTITVAAHDRLSQEGSATRTVHLDTKAPTITIVAPAPGDFTNAESVTVSGGVNDASPIASFDVNGVAARVEGSTFTADGVPTGTGASVTFTATAEDAAGNRGTASVTIGVDRSAPVVHITRPANRAYLKGPAVDVAGTAIDTTHVLVDVNEQLATVTGDAFSISLPLPEGPQAIRAVARDAAGNSAADEVHITVDSTPPAITITAPPTGFVTRETAVLVAASVSDASPVTVLLGPGGPIVPLSGGSVSVEVPLPVEGPNVITLVATDAAGNESSATVTVVRDTTPPTLQVVAPESGAVIVALPVVVQGMVADATEVTVTVDGTPAVRTGTAWQRSVSSLAEGPHTFVVEATDAAGNVTTVSVPVTLDFGPPTVTITSPASGTLTRLAVIGVDGLVGSSTVVSVTVNGVAATVTGTNPWSFHADVPLSEGVNTLTATATRGTGQPGTASVTVTRDSIPPVLLLDAPPSVGRGKTFRAAVTVTDASPIRSVVIRLGGAAVATLIAPPWEADITVPSGASPGDTLAVSAEATDAADNVGTASRGVGVLSDGVLVGQVLADLTGLPLAGVTVQLVSGTSGSGGSGGATPPRTIATTDERGRYSLPATGAAALLAITKDGLTAVEREVSVVAGVGTIPVDARLTPLGPASVIGPAGGTLTAGAVQVTLAAGAIASDAPLRLTALSPQGLPALLPLGWTPLAAFDLRADAPVAIGPGLSVAIPSSSLGGVPADGLRLAFYDGALHAWTLALPALSVSGGDAVTAAVARLGAYAVVAADQMDPPLALPETGQPLPGADVVLLPPTVTSHSQVSPSTIPATGGTARGALVVESPLAMPSGTVVQAEVTETFTLASGDLASEERRTQDIVLFRAPRPSLLPGTDEGALPGTRLFAEIPITPSRTFTTVELVEGKVHLDILAGREAVRGQTGGSQAVEVTDGILRLAVPSHALDEDTAIWLGSQALSSDVASGAGLTALAQAAVDFAGNHLSLSARLSMDAAGLPDGGTYVIARATRIDGIPRWEVVSMAAVEGGRLESQPLADLPGAPGFRLPGIVQGGQYVFYRVAGAVGFVAGTLSSAGGPVRGVLEATGLPFVALSGVDGRYALLSATGSVTVTGRVPRTSLVGSAGVAVAEGLATTLNLTLAGTVTTAVVTPANGSVAVPTGTQVEIAATTALDPRSVTADTIRLFQATATGDHPVAVRFVISGSAKVVAVVPLQALAFSTRYTLVASGLVDAFGGLVAVPQTSFTTRDDTPPVYDTSALVFSFPDADGNVTVSAAAGSFPPGTQILILNATNGDVATFVAENDGAVGHVLPATIRASISDVLLITITDPQGNVTTYKRSQFVNPTTGETAVGPGGGTVIGDGGVELRIPEGAIDAGVRIKIAGLSAAQLDSDFPGQKPTLPGATVGSGLRIESSDKPAFKKEVDLVFPLPAGVPANPSDAFFYVYRRIERPGGTALFETIDQAFVECPAGKTTCAAAEKKVVTASYPFPGYTSSYGSVDLSGTLTPSNVVIAFLMWTFDSQHVGRPLPGAITGKVLRPVFQKNDPNKPAPPVVYQPVANAWVTGVDAGKNPLVVDNSTITRTGPDGTFTMFDPFYTGGTVTVAAREGALPDKCPATETTSDLTRCGSGFEANPADWATTGLRFYKNIASANVTFPALAPPEPPPAVAIDLVKNIDPPETIAGGIVVIGTKLLVQVRAGTALVTGISLNGATCTVRAPAPGRGEVDLDTDPACTVGHPGTYQLTATALPAFGSVLTGSRSFLVIAAGGSNTTAVAGPPRVIFVSPKANADGVPVNTVVQVTFSEPVRVRDHVKLYEGEGGASRLVDIQVLGITRDGNVADIALTPEEPVTSLTIQPRLGLRFGTVHRLVLEAGIDDLDTNAAGDPAPSALDPAPYESKFKTFGPTSVGGTDETYGSPGIVVLQDRAYLVQNDFVAGTLRGYDITDPVKPVEIETARAHVTWRPVDIAGAEESEVSSGRLVVVATGPTNVSKPSNLYLFDTTDDKESKWIGAVSLTSSAVEGFINRIAVKSPFVISATMKKGLQVVDMRQAKESFAPCCDTEYWRMVQSFNTDGQGFGQGAVTQTIDVPGPSGGAPARLLDVDAADYEVDGISQTLVFSTGDVPLVVANPQTGQLYPPVPIRTAPDAQGKVSSLTYGYAMALGTVGSRRLAVIAGSGSVLNGPVGPVLAVASMNADPTRPQTLAVLSLASEKCLTDPVTDVIMKDDRVLIGTITCVGFVTLTDAERPRVTGTLTGLGGRLGLSNSGLLLTTARSVFGGDDPLGGVRTASLENLAYFRRISPEPFPLTDGKNDDAVVMDVGIVPEGYKIDTAEVDVFQGGNTVATLPVTFNSPGKAVLPAGFTFNANTRYEAQIVINRGDPQTRLLSIRKSLRPVELRFAETQQVEVVDGAKKRNVDVVKLYDARPRVDFRWQGGAPVLPTEGVLEGTVNDDLAPIDTVWVNGVKVTARPLPALPSPDRPTDPIDSFNSDFSTNVYRVRPDAEVASMSGFPLPEFVTYGFEGMVLAATATNALGNVGWNHALYVPNMKPDGDEVEVAKTPGKRLPPGDPPINSYYPLEDGVGRSEQRRFRIEVKDSGLVAAATRILVRLYTGIEDPHLITLYRLGTAFVSPPLYLVPESFSLPAGLNTTLRDYLLATRLKAKLGVKVKVTYVTSDINKEAVVSGVALVDEQDQPIRYVPGQTLAPQITITNAKVEATTENGNATVRVAARVVDPVAATLGSSVTLIKVSVNGFPVNPQSLGSGVYSFDQVFSLPPLPETHLQVRAESLVTGGWGVDDRFILFEDDEGRPLGSPLVQDGFGARGFLSQPRAFRVKAYGPPVAVGAMTGTVKGLYSKDLPLSPGLPPSTPLVAQLAFDTPKCSNDLCTYMSKDKFLASKVPGYSLKEPFGGSQSDAALVVPVEIGGLVQSRVEMGSAGVMGSLTDVSGAEIVIPRDGGIINLAKQTVSPYFAGVQGVSVKWRGIRSMDVLEQASGNATDDGIPKVPVGSSIGFSNWPKESTIIKFSAWAKGTEHLFTVERAQDTAGNSFVDEAASFIFSESLVSNPTRLDRDTPRISPSDSQMAPGRFLAPTVTDGFDLLYAGGTSDYQISEHLRMNGLRPVAMKRNEGSLVTAVRIDGKDAMFDPVLREVPDAVPRSGIRPNPEDDVAIDGDDLRFRDIKSVGLDMRYLGTYDEYDAKDFPVLGARARSEVIQKARARLNLPPSEGGKSIEYQLVQNAADWRLLRQTIDDILLFLPFIQELFAAYLGESFIAMELTTGGGVAPKVVEVPLVAGEPAVAEDLELYLVNQPKLTRIADQTLSASGNDIKALATQYRRAQREALAFKWLGMTDKMKTAQQKMRLISNQLGTAAVKEVAALHPELGIPAGAQPLCCLQFPQVGGAATGKFDFVYEAANGRYVIIEAKGGVSYFNPKSWWNAGRKIVDPISGRRTYEIQGTLAYVQKTVELMRANTQTGSLAVKLEQALVDGKLDYYLVSAKWSSRAPAGASRVLAGEKGIVWGAQKAARVFKADLTAPPP